MKNNKNLPLAIVAFFSFLIAFFFAVEQLHIYPNTIANHAMRKMNAAKGVFENIPGNIEEKVFCPGKKCMKIGKKLFCKSMKLAFKALAFWKQPKRLASLAEISYNEINKNTLTEDSSCNDPEREGFHGILPGLG